MNMNSTSIAEFITGLQNKNSKLEKDMAELNAKHDAQKELIMQLKNILKLDVQVGEDNSERRQDLDRVEDLPVDEYIRLHGYAADLPVDEKFMSYHVSDMLYWLEARESDECLIKEYGDAAGAIYNMNHEIKSGQEAMELNPDKIGERVARMIDRYLQTP